MIKDIQELNFPSYATLSSATVTLNDMGDRTISAQVKIDGDIVPDFSYDWEVEFKGERYIQPLRQPQASKGNESMCSKIDLVFYHETIWQLKRYYFVEMTSTMSGTAIADQYIASLGLNLSDFCIAFQRVLDHYFNGNITIDLNPNLEYTKGVQFMSISYSYIWDVLQKVYEVYGVRWHIEGDTIKVGYPSSILSHTFQYGYEGGLLQVERQVQDANIRNSLLGRGGEQNLPVYYFKEAPEGSLFASDPDAIPELANIDFSNLRGKTFRDYVKGWKAKHYGGAPMSEPTEAYTKGYTDTEFNPIEYVEDKESIKKYGLLPGALDNNEEIYPSIQGAPNGEDVVVYVEPVTSDDVEQSVGKAETIALNGMSQYKQITGEQNGGQVTITLQSEVFEVPNDSYALAIGNNVTYNIYRGFNLTPIWEGNVLVDVIEVVTNKATNQIVDKSSLSKGKYQVVTTFNMTLPIYEDFPPIGSADNITFSAQLGVSTNLQLRKLQDGATDKWLPTFDIWVKNIWHSTRNVGESDEQYAERVWRPILGDRQGDEAKVVFSSGWLSGHEDYEFTIVDFAYDNSHEGSEWRLTLNKSDAELEATGKYIPSASTNGQAYAGDTFFFIGINMPHQYVLWAEERLDNYKTSALNEVSEIQPKWVVRFDKLRLHEGGDNLAEQIVVGGAINLADVRFIDAPALQLYLQSVTYTWNEQTLLYPDIEVVLADTIVPVQNPVAQLQGSIDTINSQLANIGNVAQVVRKIGDSLYLRKDGVADTSKSPTKFVGEVSGNNFRRGKVGGADWGIYRDENGNAIAEFDKIIARKDLDVNNLVINQVSYVGGMQITSAASIEITRVIENGNAYQCFFDQKRGSVANLFRVNDIAYSQRFDEENNTTKYYKRVVIAVDIDSISLSKSQADGEGVPMSGDVVIHYGNITDTNRQYVIIRDVIGGGYERMLSDLNSVSASGVEYYFAGRLDGNTPRWFVGNNEQFIEYKDGHLRIKADVTLGEESTLPDNLNVDYLKKAFPQGSILDVNGVTLSALIGVKDNEDKVVAGIYGGASNTLNEQGYADEEHGAMLLFGGIDGADKPKSYKTAIFEDGYIESEYFATARKNERVEIFDNQIKIYGSDGKTHILLGWSAETGNPHLQYVDANGARPWLITEQGVSNAVTINTEQSITGIKNFANGLKIGGVHIKYDAEKKALFLPFNLVVEGGVAWNSSIEGFNPKTITEAVQIDNKTIKINDNGALYVAGGTGGGGFDEEQLANYLAQNRYVTEEYVSSSLTDYLSLSGGTIDGNLWVKNTIYTKVLSVDSPQPDAFLAMKSGKASAASYLVYKSGTEWFITDEGWHNNYAILHANNISQFALSASGGTVNGSVKINGSNSAWAFTVEDTNSYYCSAHADGYGFFIGSNSKNAGKYIIRAFAGDKYGRVGGGGVQVFEVLDNGDVNIYGNATASKFVGTLEGSASALSGSGFGYPGYDANTASATTIVRYTYGNNAPCYGTLLDVSINLCGFQLNTTSNSDSPLYYRRHAHPNEGGFGAWQQLARVTESSLTPTGGTLTVNGNILSTGRIAWNSSRVLKNIIDERYLTLDEMLQMKPYTYTWKDGRDSLIHVGAIADDIKWILPETVLTDSKDIHSMDYAQTAYVMCASLARELAIAKAEIRELKGVA